MSDETKETNDAVIAAAKFYKLGKEVYADKKIGLSDIPLIIGAAPGIISSTSAAVENGGKIPSEIGHMTSEGAAKLTESIKKEFGVDEAKALTIIEGSLQVLAGGAKIASVF